MSTYGNNNNQEAALLRDTFFTKEEKRYFLELMQNARERKHHVRLSDKDVKKLYNKAKELIERVENCEFNEKEMEEVEYTIAHLLAAIEDYQHVNEKSFL